MAFKQLSIFCAAVALLLFMPYQAGAETAQSKQFLELSEGQRTWWTMGAIEAFWLQTNQTSKEQADCIVKWYFDNQDARQKEIEDAIRARPEFSSIAVVMGLLHRDCGKF